MKTKDDIDIVDVEQRLYDLERKVTNMVVGNVVGKPPQPRTPRLVEAVDKLLLHLNDYYSGDTLQVCKDRVAVALAAEKNRQELVDELKHTIRVWQNRGCNQSCVITAIDNLDAYEKGEAQ